jgi:hypothetical protein
MDDGRSVPHCGSPPAARPGRLLLRRRWKPSAPRTDRERHHDSIPEHRAGRSATQNVDVFDAVGAREHAMHHGQYPVPGRVAPGRGSRSTSSSPGSIPSHSAQGGWQQQSSARDRVAVSKVTSSWSRGGVACQTGIERRAPMRGDTTVRQPYSHSSEGPLQLRSMPSRSLNDESRLN